MKRRKRTKATESPWWGAKVLFQHTDLAERRGETVFEERVVLIRARTAEQAIERAEKVARAYVKDLDGGCKYLGFLDVFHPWQTRIGSGSEIYSLMRTSRLSPKKYLDRFYDTGKERTTTHRSARGA